MITSINTITNINMSTSIRQEHEKDNSMDIDK